MSRSLNEVVSRAWENHVLLSLMLELTYACELKCQFCYNDRKRRGRILTFGKYEEILKDARDLGCLYLTLTGGEPTLSKDFFRIGALAKVLRYAVRIKTHGSFMDSSLIERIKKEVDPVGLDVSIHGDNAETHDELTQIPGSFNRLLRHLQLFSESGLSVTLRCPITRLNQDQIEGILEIGDRHGMRVKFSPEITYRDDGDRSPRNLAPDRESVNRYYQIMRQRASRGIEFVDEESTDENRENLTTRYNCGAGTGSLTIDPYGEVLPCVAWRRGLGNIRETSLREKIGRASCRERV